MAYMMAYMAHINEERTMNEGTRGEINGPTDRVGAWARANRLTPEKINAGDLSVSDAAIRYREVLTPDEVDATAGKVAGESGEWVGPWQTAPMVAHYDTYDLALA